METTPAEVKRRMDAGEPIILIDVREPEEYQLARIEGSHLIPMKTVPAAISELEEKAEVGTLVFLCHHGVRSANVVNYLRGQGITASQTMSGGIDRWSLEIDSSVPRY